MATPTVQLNMRVPAELHGRLVQQAARFDMSVTAYVLEAIERYIVNPPAAKVSRAALKGAKL